MSQICISFGQILFSYVYYLLKINPVSTKSKNKYLKMHKFYTLFKTFLVYLKYYNHWTKMLWEFLHLKYFIKEQKKYF